MTGRVFAFDPSSYWGADDAVDVTLGIVQSAPDEVISAALCVLKIGTGDRHSRASVATHLGGSLAATIEAVHDAVPTRLTDSAAPDFVGLSSVYCLGQLRLAVIEDKRPIQARALLETEFCEILADEGLDLSPAYSALGVRPLPLRDSTLEALSLGEMTLAVADSLLASMPWELIHEAAARDQSGDRDASEFGRRLFRSLFPGRKLPAGTDILWHDAVVLSSRAVTEFVEWRSAMTAYQSALGDDQALARVVNRALSTLATTASVLAG